MSCFKVAEKFVSINGEGPRAGELAVFLRFCGCNLNCGYCDTRWANTSDVKYELISAEELVAYVKSTGVKNVYPYGRRTAFTDEYCVSYRTVGRVRL